MEIERIIIELCLYKSLDEIENLINVTRIHNYICSNYTYDEEVKDLDELLYKGYGNSYSNSLLFSELLNSINLENKIMKSHNTMEDNHYFNLVKINDLYYIFDVSLDMRYYTKKNNILLYAGMGIDSYSKLYTIDSELPNNVLKESLDVKLINHYKS